jgi:uncharacterized protein HemY
MRNIIRRSAAILAFSALALSALPALACGSEGEASQVISRPPQQSAASELFAEASRLDLRANALENRAASTDRQADESSVEARALRVEAVNIETGDRSRLLAIADTLSSQAATGHSQARQLRDQAIQLRQVARSDRERANRLVGGGGRWRGGPVATTI